MRARPLAIIAGGSGKVGSAVSRRLIGSGHAVLVLDRVAPRFSDSALDYLSIDLTDEAALGALAEETAAPQVLVNCQGWSPKDDTGRARDPATLSGEEFVKIVEVNLLSCFLTLHRFVPAMAQRGGGRVVNVSSTSARTGRTTASAAYAAAKAGLDALTRLFAVRYGPSNVIVCGVAPGKLESDGRCTDPPEVLARYRREVPLGRLGRCEEIADAIAFLASERNPYLTGQTVIIDGGRLA